MYLIAHVYLKGFQMCGGAIRIRIQQCTTTIYNNAFIPGYYFIFCKNKLYEVT